jgi:hypothetical protein
MFSFIVSTCIKNNLHLNQLKRCIQSITTYHSSSYIYIINDSDELYILEIQNLIKNNKNIFLVESKLIGSADQQVFNLIMNIDDDASHYIIIQDSMFLNKMFENVDKIQDVSFLWCFTNHIIDWDKIQEPYSSFNTSNGIVNHTDLIRHHLVNNYFEDNNFLSYALNCLLRKETWVGCFGNCCIITKKCVNFLNSKTKFCEKFIKNNTNRERRVNESIFAIICHYYLPQKYELAYDGLYYDGISANAYSNVPTGFDNLTYCCKNKYLSKISFER